MFNLFTPGSSKINQDIAKLRELLEKGRKNLIPWNSDEYEHLSYQEGEIEGVRTSKRWHSGLFFTIFYEKIVAYAFKTYFWSSDKLMCVQTRSDEYLYHHTGKTIRVACNDYAIGRITDKGVLLAPKKKRELGKIKHEHRLGHLIIQVGGNDLAHLRLPEDIENYNQKVFEFIRPLNEDVEKHFYALVFYIMTRKHLD